MDAMTTPRRLAALADIAPSFPALLCDVWGVVHNGVRPFAPAVAALVAYRRRGGIVVLITNAPRPRHSVAEQLDQIGVDAAAYDDIVSSGDVARETLSGRENARIFHLGPDRDLSLYEELSIELVPLDQADLVSCTGLYDDETETPSDYDELFGQMKARRLAMVCANPDLVVERGDRIIPCAGALAVRYRDQGGAVDIVGKPHAPIYRSAIALIGDRVGAKTAPADILAIGDGAATDMVGANRAGLRSLYISSGMRSADAGANIERPDAVAAFLARFETTADYYMPSLS